MPKEIQWVMVFWMERIYGLFTLHGTAGGTGNGIGTIGSNAYWSLSPSRTSVNISTRYIRTHWSWSRSVQCGCTIKVFSHLTSKVLMFVNIVSVVTNLNGSWSETFSNGFCTSFFAIAWTEMVSHNSLRLINHRCECTLREVFMFSSYAYPDFNIRLCTEF